MNEFIPVNILIGDRSYRLKVKPEDEEKLRKTVKIINDKVIEYKTSFAGKDMQDYIAMVLIWLATEFTDNSFSGFKSHDLLEKIKSLSSLVEHAVK